MLLDSLVMLGSRGYMALAKVLVSILVVHGFGAGGQGMYAIALNVSVIAALTGAAGLEVANAYDSGRRPDLVRTLILQSAAVSLGAGGALGLMLWLAFPLIGIFDGFDPGYRLLVVLSPPLAILTNLLTGIASGAARFRLIAGTSAILSSVLVAGAAVGLVTESALLPFGAWLAGNLAASLVIGAVLWRQLPGRPVFRGSGLATRLRFSQRVYFANLANWLNMRLDLLVVAALLGSVAAGTYAVAATLAEGLLYLGKSVSQPLMARAIRSTSAWDRPALRPYRLVIGTTAAAGVALALLAPALLEVLYGAHMRDAAVPLMVLAFAMPAIAFVTLASSHLFGLGLAGPAVIAAAVSTTITVMLDLALVPRLGITAAAGAALIAYVIAGTILYRHLRVHLAASVGVADVLLPAAEDARGVWRQMRRAWHGPSVS